MLRHALEGKDGFLNLRDKGVYTAGDVTQFVLARIVQALGKVAVTAGQVVSQFRCLGNGN